MPDPRDRGDRRDPRNAQDALGAIFSRGPATPVSPVFATRIGPEVITPLKHSATSKTMWTLPPLWTQRTRPQGFGNLARNARFPQRPHRSSCFSDEEEERRRPLRSTVHRTGSSPLESRRDCPSWPAPQAPPGWAGYATEPHLYCSADDRSLRPVVAIRSFLGGGYLPSQSFGVLYSRHVALSWNRIDFPLRTSRIFNTGRRMSLPVQTRRSAPVPLGRYT